MVRFVIQLKVTLTFNRHQWLDSLKQFVAHDIPELSWACGHGVSYGDLQIILLLRQMKVQAAFKRCWQLHLIDNLLSTIFLQKGYETVRVNMQLKLPTYLRSIDRIRQRSVHHKTVLGNHLQRRFYSSDTTHNSDDCPSSVIAQAVERRWEVLGCKQLKL